MIEATRQHGLAGKERRRREFRRARQRFADHLVAEYFDADEEVERARLIPIRRCSAYLQGPGRDEAGEDAAFGLQLELSLDEPQRLERPGEREVVWPPVPVDTAPRTKLIDESMLKLEKSASSKPTPEVRERAIRFETAPARPARSKTALPFPQEWRPPMGYRSRRREFSLGGFAYGCLLGGAAAACLLLIVHVVLR